MQRGENWASLHVVPRFAKALDMSADRLVAEVEAALAEGHGGWR